MPMRGSHQHQRYARPVPLQLVGERQNGSGKSDDTLLSIVDYVLARRWAKSQKDSLMTPIRVFDFLLGSVLRSASLAKTNQSTIDGSEANPFV